MFFVIWLNCPEFSLHINCIYSDCLVEIEISFSKVFARLSNNERLQCSNTSHTVDGSKRKEEEERKVEYVTTK